MNNDILPPYHIHCFYEITSCMDKAYELIGEGSLPVWDSVLTVTQTAGRGQMRRVWQSLPGNLYAALHLPNSYPFNGPCAAAAVSAACLEVLRKLGFIAYLKWPNDLVMEYKKGYAKIAGILIEEKNSQVVAGIGINLAIAPDSAQLRADKALPAACLAQSGLQYPAPLDLWLLIAKKFYEIYAQTSIKDAAIWKNSASEFLLWKNMAVEIDDGQHKQTGLLKDIGYNGGAVLQKGQNLLEIFTGSLRKSPK